MLFWHFLSELSLQKRPISNIPKNQKAKIKIQTNLCLRSQVTAKVKPQATLTIIFKKKKKKYYDAKESHPLIRFPL